VAGRWSKTSLAGGIVSVGRLDNLSNMNNLKKLGIEKISPKQQPVIDSLLAGNDTLAIMPTGSGKSLCYQYPALEMAGTAVVVSPLIALMKDQVDFLKSRNVQAEVINSTLTTGKKADIFGKLKERSLKIIYLSPEGLQSETICKVLNNAKISFFAIDEAHCISTWGHDFRKSYRKLMHIKAGFPNHPIIALTATATPKTRQDIVDQLDMRNPREFIYSFDRPNLKFSVVPSNKKGCFEIIESRAEGQIIIYGFTRQDVELTAIRLNSILGHKLEKPFFAYHAGMSHKKRVERQDLFMSGEINVVCTKAFGMGINNPNVRLVLHNNIPPTLEGLYQESGRAGRDGQEAECILRFDMEDVHKMDCFLENRHGDNGRYPILHEKLMEVGKYCVSGQCRRKTILEYFGEQYQQDNCGMCDVCLS
jgi:ATP-dependent DNA helicase RecQ